LDLVGFFCMNCTMIQGSAIVKLKRTAQL